MDLILIKLDWEDDGNRLGTLQTLHIDTLLPLLLMKSASRSTSLMTLYS